MKVRRLEQASIVEQLGIISRDRTMRSFISGSLKIHLDILWPFWRSQPLRHVHIEMNISYFIDVIASSGFLKPSIIIMGIDDQY